MNNIFQDKNKLLKYLLILFAGVYLIVVFRLNFLGEGAHHADIAKSLTISQSNSYFYPGLHEMLTSVITSISGIDAIKLISPLCVVFIALLIPAFLKNFGIKNSSVILSVIVILFSTKLLRLGFEPLIEIPQTFLIIVVIYYLLIKYELSNKTILAVVFLTAIAGYKQQGLIVTCALLFVMFGFELFRNKKVLILEFIITFVLILSIYLPMILRTGVLLEPSRREVAEILVTNESNIINKLKYPLLTERYKSDGTEIFLYNKTSDKSNLINKGIISFEEKHIPLTKQITNISNFLRVNSLYLGFQGILLLLLSIMSLFDSKNKKFITFKIVLIITWIFSQAFMYIGGYGTEKYFIFIPVIFTILSLKIVHNLTENEYASNKFIKLIFLCFLFSIIISGSERVGSLIYFNNTQSYGTSKGGIQAVQEISKIINTKGYKKIIAPSTYEWLYYTEDVEVFADSQIYFLSENEIKEFIKINKIDAVIIQNSLIQEENWNHRGMYPIEFVNKILKIAKNIIHSEEKDIFIVQL